MFEMSATDTNTKSDAAKPFVIREIWDKLSIGVAFYLHFEKKPGF